MQRVMPSQVLGWFCWPKGGKKKREKKEEKLEFSVPSLISQCPQLCNGIRPQSRAALSIK